MKRKFRSMGRVAIALVLALSLSLVMAVPVSAETGGTIELDALDTEWYDTGTVTGEAVGTTDGVGNLTETLANTNIVPGSVILYDGDNVFTDDGSDNLVSDGDGSGSIDYGTGAVTISTGAFLADVTADYTYDSPYRTVGITVNDADLNVPGPNPDEASLTLPDDVVVTFPVLAGLPMSAWPANLVTVKDIKGTSFEVASVNDITGEVTLTAPPPAVRELGFSDADDLAADLVGLDVQPYQPTELTATATAGTLTDDVFEITITGTDVAGDPLVTLLTLNSGNTWGATTTGDFFDAVSLIAVVHTVTDNEDEELTITAFNKVFVTYTGAVVDTVDVNVNSSSNTTGITVTLTETSAVSGIFTGDVVLVAADPGSDKLLVAHADTVTATYEDEDPVATVTAEATVDDEGPVIDNEIPADELFIVDSTPLFSVEVTDPDSGVSYETWTVITDDAGLGAGGDITAELSYTSIADGYRLEYLVASVDALEANQVLIWTVTVSDSIGNVSEAVFTFTYDPSPPSMTGAETGTHWDADKGYVVDDPDDAASIMVTFDEDLNPTTVQPSDFEVTVGEEVVVILSASTYEDAGYDLVFLTLATELDTDATPTVTLDGSVTDTLGNELTSDEVADASDGIGPVLTVTTDPADLSAAEDVDVTVVASEELGFGSLAVKVNAATVIMTSTDNITFTGTFTVDASGLNSLSVVGQDLAGNDQPVPETTMLGTLITERTPVDDLAVEEPPDVFSVSLIVRPDGENDVAGTITIDGLSLEGDAQATIAVDVPGYADYAEYPVVARHWTAITDVDALDIAAGAATIELLWVQIAGDVSVEGDIEAPTVTILPATVIGTLSPTITLTFNDDEYPGDTYLMVEVTSITLDEVDMLDDIVNMGLVGGDHVYTLATTNLAEELHTVSLAFTDAAGNSGTAEETFTVQLLYEKDISLVSGWNLISLPLIPENPSIEIVLAGVEGVVSVWGFDAGEWLIYASPIEELTEMVDGAAYWVYMSAPATLTVSGYVMPLEEPPAPPPTPVTYSVVAGWNLVGFKSLEAMDYGDYFAGIEGQYGVIWGFEAGAYYNLYPLELPETDINPGEGFWIWMTDDGTIVPPR